MVPTPPGRSPLSYPPGGILRTDHDGPAHLIMCPCGCGQLWTVRHLVVSGSLETEDLTLKPSLVFEYTNPNTKKVTGCGWHGFLVDGVFTSV